MKVIVSPSKMLSRKPTSCAKFDSLNSCFQSLVYSRSLSCLLGAHKFSSKQCKFKSISILCLVFNKVEVFNSLVHHLSTLLIIDGILD